MNAESQAVPALAQAGPVPSARPLLATAVPELLDEMLAACAGAGITPVVATDTAALARGWTSATAVLIDVQQAARAAHLPERPHVVVVGAADEPLWDVAARIGAGHVAVLPGAGPWLVKMLQTAGERGAATAPVLCVMGGHGGAGATTLAAALARRAAGRGMRTLLVDADPRSGGIDLALGLETADGDRWPQVVADRREAAGELTPGFLDRLPARGSLRVLSADRLTPAAGALAAGLPSVLRQGRRGCDLVIVDLPRSVDAATDVTLAVARRTYVVLSAQVRAVAAAAALVTSVREHCADLQAVVRGPAPGGLTSAGITRSLGIPLAAVLRPEPGLIRDYERGVPPGQPRAPLARLCDALLNDLTVTTGSSGAAA